MTRLGITVKTLSPLYVGAFKPYGLFLETHREISGALLRGTISGRLLQDCAALEFKPNHEACTIKNICPFYYLTAGVAFPTCAVAEAGHLTEPPLRTMVTCKAAPGFTTEPDRRPHEQGHGVFDTLLHYLVFNELRHLDAPSHTLPPQRCETCDAPLEPFSKRYIRERPGRYRSASSVHTRRVTRVGINRRRETAEWGLLFSVQAVSEQTTFVGTMTLPDLWNGSRVEEFKKALRSITRLGGEQTYGLGHVEVTVKEVEDEGEDVTTRIRNFNEKLREVWRDRAPNQAPEQLDADYFTVDLLTPALLTTPDGTPTVQLTAQMLKERAQELGFTNLPELENMEYPDDAGIKRVLMLTAPLIASGWSEAWRLPKPTALAAVAGSVYVFRTNDISAWQGALTKIEAYGIGARREEGSGSVRVCNPFHQEVKPV